VSEGKIDVRQERSPSKSRYEERETHFPPISGSISCLEKKADSKICCYLRSLLCHLL